MSLKLLSRGYSVAHQRYGVLLGLLGRFEQAFPKLDRARDWDPLSPVIHWTIGYLRLPWPAQFLRERCVQTFQITIPGSM